MKVVYLGTQLTEQEKEQVRKILYASDEEFYPPLSARVSSSQKVLKQENGLLEKKSSEPIAYFNEMIRQDFLLAYDDSGDVIGFMTFRQNYICDALREFGPSLYITTICVREDQRGKGTMAALYSCMEQEVTRACGCRKVSTRTWSLNQAQIHSLSQRGYDTLALLPNDRGNGVDTIYYGITVSD